MLEPTRIFALRHGETAWNVAQRIQGQLDVPLNERGREQAARLAQALQGEGLAAIHSSDLQRAAATAQALADACGLPVKHDAALRERAFGRFEGETYTDIEARWPEDALRWRKRDVDFAPGGGETLRDFSDRCVSTITRLAHAHRGEAIAVVAHGGVLDCLYRASARMALDAPRTWQLGNAAINRVLFNGEGFVVIGWNDHGHLEGLDDDAHA
jgi:2,3-bisphosphoglycerate-dependent phosphoglycerate mutase